MALGGVPIGVPIPPRLAAIGIESASATLPVSLSGRALSTGARNASIMAAVAVLLMNIENRLITIRKPRSTNLEFLPNIPRSTFAIAASIPYLDATIASTKPPRKSMTTGSANEAIIVL